MQDAVRRRLTFRKAAVMRHQTKTADHGNNSSNLGKYTFLRNLNYLCSIIKDNPPATARVLTRGTA